MATKTWFAQKNDEYNSIAAIKNLVHYLHVPVTNTTIELSIRNLPNFPGVDLTELVNLLNDWKIEIIQSMTKTRSPITITKCL